jgi:hypothetical protein
MHIRERFCACSHLCLHSSRGMSQVQADSHRAKLNPFPLASTETVHPCTNKTRRRDSMVFFVPPLIEIGRAVININSARLLSHRRTGTKSFFKRNKTKSTRQLFSSAVCSFGARTIIFTGWWRGESGCRWP